MLETFNKAGLQNSLDYTHTSLHINQYINLYKIINNKTFHKPTTITYQL